MFYRWCKHCYSWNTDKVRKNEVVKHGVAYKVESSVFEQHQTFSLLSGLTGPVHNYRD